MTDLILPGHIQRERPSPQQTRAETIRKYMWYLFEISSNITGEKITGESSPEEIERVVKRAYETKWGSMNVAGFGWALSLMKDGKKMTREGWNGRNMWVVYQKAYPDGIAINANTAEATGYPEGSLRRFLPYLMLCTADGNFVPWTPSQTDVLAEDWSVIGSGSEG